MSEFNVSESNVRGVLPYLGKEPLMILPEETAVIALGANLVDEVGEEAKDYLGVLRIQNEHITDSSLVEVPAKYVPAVYVAMHGLLAAITDPSKNFRDSEDFTSMSGIMSHLRLKDDHLIGYAGIDANRLIDQMNNIAAEEAAAAEAAVAAADIDQEWEAISGQMSANARPQE